MNTKFTYRHYDGSDHSPKWKSIVLSGVLRYEDIAAYMEGGRGFIAHDVGLQELQILNADAEAAEKTAYPAFFDHLFHETYLHDIIPTELPATEDFTAAELLARFVKVGNNWDVAAAIGRFDFTHPLDVIEKCMTSLLQHIVSQTGAATQPQPVQRSQRHSQQPDEPK